jgi:hypothetical protein
VCWRRTAVVDGLDPLHGYRGDLYEFAAQLCRVVFGERFGDLLDQDVPPGQLSGLACVVAFLACCLGE